ncbi:MAG: hypothetical protein HYY05_01205 [Chloroflexi bacterium]|nr:hypothetical protein [Chloroflexota bacterium]
MRSPATLARRGLLQTRLPHQRDQRLTAEAAAALNGELVRIYRHAYELGVVTAIRVGVQRDACSECRSIAGEYSWWQRPSLPNANCSSVEGCRCLYEAVPR